jgi:hypothetical protein
LEVFYLRFWHITTFFPTIIIMPRPNNGGGGGRIRVTDDSAVTLGAEVEVRAEHVSAVNATKTKESFVETRRGHRRRMKKLIEWWMIEYPDYFEVGTRVLSAEEKADSMKYYHTCDRDIEYEGLRVDMVIAYMAATKAKATEEGAVAKRYSYEHMRKIHDAFYLVQEQLRRYCQHHTILRCTVFFTHSRKRLRTLAVMGMLTRKVLIQSAFPSSI